MKIREAFFIFLMMAFGAIAIMYRVKYDKAVDNSANHIEMGYVVNGKYQPVYETSCNDGLIQLRVGSKDGAFVRMTKSNGRNLDFFVEGIGKSFSNLSHSKLVSQVNNEGVASTNWMVLVNAYWDKWFDINSKLRQELVKETKDDVK